MKKSERKSILENLDKALTPPAPKRKPPLASLLADYDDSEDEPKNVLPTMPSQTSQTTPTSQTRQGDAPTRDFAKVPNSLTRVSIPAGEFKGKSKQLYDTLYSLTRGAISPKRTVRISRPQLMKKSGIGARVTFETNISHLIGVGLVQVRQIAGEHEGNEYTVFLPEERSMPSQTSQSRHAQDQDRLVRLETSQTRHTSSREESTTSVDPKTSFKTKDQDDDEDVPKRLRVLERELTGKVSPAAKWMPLFELLANELKAAAARTGSVSDAPAFFTEHLRRRFTKPDSPPKTGKPGATTEPLPLPPEEIAPPAPDDVEEFERARAELEGK